MKAFILLCVVLITMPACAHQIPLREMAGHWRVRALALDRDSVLTTYQLWTSEDTTQWKIKFDNRADTIKVHVLNVGRDSVLIQTGPYRSALRNGVMVTTQTVLRLRAGRLHGRSTARYADTEAVLQVRTEGVRAVAPATQR